MSVFDFIAPLSSGTALIQICNFFPLEKKKKNNL